MTAERFTLKKKLGEGAFGVVWLAEDRARPGREVALKILRKRLVEKPIVRSRFVREAEILASFDHPAIAGFVDWFPGEEETILALEYVPGVTLRREIFARAQQGIYFDDLLLEAIFGDVASALDYAHARGVVHRDLKPSNIIVAEKKATVVDFGVAKLTGTDAESATTIGRVLGSRLYMSPEQTRGEDIDQRSDIFSLGAILFELLTLQPAFGRAGEGENDPFLIAKRVMIDPRPRASELEPAIPRAVDEVLARALAISAGDRYATAGELFDAFRRARDSTVARPSKKSSAELTAPGVAEPNEDTPILAAASDETPILAVPIEIPLRAEPAEWRRARGLAIAAVIAILVALAATAVIALRAPPPLAPLPSEEARARTAAVPRASAKPAEAAAPERSPIKTPARSKARAAAPAAPAIDRPFAALRALLDRVAGDPSDLAAVGRLADGISAAADQLADEDARTSIRRCVTAGSVSADPQELSVCLDDLERAAAR